MIDWSKISTADILEELIKRDKNGDNNFHLMSESVTSYTFSILKIIKKLMVLHVVIFILNILSLM